jgi:hypothetical protein
VLLVLLEMLLTGSTRPRDANGAAATVSSAANAAIACSGYGNGSSSSSGGAAVLIAVGSPLTRVLVLLLQVLVLLMLLLVLLIQHRSAGSKGTPPAAYTLKYVIAAALGSSGTGCVCNRRFEA